MAACLTISIHQLYKFRGKSEQPFLSIISNNLGVKTKLLSLQLTTEQFLAVPSDRTLRKLVTRYKVIKGSINTDLKSDATIQFHKETGDLAQLVALQTLLDQLEKELPTSPTDTHRAYTFKKQTEKAFRLWNRYTTKIIQAVQKQSLNIHNQWFHSLTVQIWLMILIAVLSLFILAFISRQLIAQRKMSDELQLQAKELKSARYAAEESTHAKSRFLSNMSHEIRTPLNGIIGLTNLALHKSNEIEVNVYLDKILMSSDALLHVINDILDVSKIESGKLELEITEINLVELIDKLSATTYETAVNKGLEFYIFIAPETPSSISGDPTRLLQILINLVSNAIKFTSDGWISLSVSYSEETSEITFAITDTGIGINIDEFDGLFDEFSQADVSTTRKFGGTGLGLSITKSLTEMMKGHLFIESSPGYGSTFKVKLPVTHCNEMPSNEDALIKPEQVSELKWQLISFDPHQLQYTQSILERSGLNFTQPDLANAILILLPSNNTPDRQLIVDIIQSHKGKACFLYANHKYLMDLKEQSNIARMNVNLVESPFNNVKFIEHLTHNNQVKEKTISNPLDIYRFPGKRVLLVEDTPINQMVAQEMLTQMEIEVVLANNGLEAVTLTQAQSFDLILMDIQMPEMDGIEATRKIKRLQPPINTPVVALTANVMKEDIERYKEVGMNDYLPKPFQPNRLVEILETYLRDDSHS
jgi:signal transduction histidine kinase/CheY-like chemotaxis protein